MRNSCEVGGVAASLAAVILPPAGPLLSLGIFVIICNTILRCHSHLDSALAHFHTPLNKVTYIHRDCFRHLCLLEPHGHPPLCIACGRHGPYGPAVFQPGRLNTAINAVHDAISRFDRIAFYRNLNDYECTPGFASRCCDDENPEHSAL